MSAVALYSVCAYRWGALNNHHYEVGVFADRDEALRVAEEACNDRGGKYGVIVREWASGQPPRMAAYFSSMVKENAPYEDHFLQAAQDIGQEARAVAVNGFRLTADPEGIRPNIPLEAEVPAWLAELVRDHLHQAHYAQAADEDEKRHPTVWPEPPLSRQWLREQSRARSDRIAGAVDQAVEAEYARGAELKKRMFER